MKNFELYANGQLIGIYLSRNLAALDAFELMLDGAHQTFEIIEVPSIEQLQPAS